jgi:hypothetical protein
MQSDRTALERLTPLVGEWDLETSFAPPGGVRARAMFEWALGGQFLVQRSEIDVPEAPDSLMVVAADPETDGFTQHYFDSRGVVRLYAMTFDDNVWTLRRESPDFTPLSFAQRFVGTMSDDGDTIEGRWETMPPGGSTWEHDFDLTYKRIGRAS